jgi:hypothetical protein
MVIYRDNDFQDLKRHKLRFTKYDLRIQKAGYKKQEKALNVKCFFLSPLGRG